MATQQQHEDYAREYMAAADQIEKTSPAAAGELDYGALRQAAMAFAHNRDDNNHAQTRKDINAEILRAPINRSRKDRLMAQVNLAFSILHRGFYQPERVDRNQHPKTRQEVRRAIRTFLALANC